MEKPACFVPIPPSTQDREFLRLRDWQRDQILGRSGAELGLSGADASTPNNSVVSPGSPSDTEG